MILLFTCRQRVSFAFLDLFQYLVIKYSFISKLRPKKSALSPNYIGNFSSECL
jgi:hypothetical protein